MDPDDQDNALFNISLSPSASSEDLAKEEARARRTGQSEDSFQAVKRDYHAKIENGSIFKSVKLPIRASAPKPYLQEVLHAVEELYFFRRYRDASDFVQQVLESSPGLDLETRQLLTIYEERCQQRLKSTS